MGDQSSQASGGAPEDQHWQPLESMPLKFGSAPSGLPGVTPPSLFGTSSVGASLAAEQAPAAPVLRSDSNFSDIGPVDADTPATPSLPTSEMGFTQLTDAMSDDNSQRSRDETFKAPFTQTFSATPPTHTSTVLREDTEILVVPALEKRSENAMDIDEAPKEEIEKEVPPPSPPREDMELSLHIPESTPIESEEKIQEKTEDIHQGEEEEKKIETTAEPVQEEADDSKMDVSDLKMVEEAEDIPESSEQEPSASLPNDSKMEESSELIASSPQKSENTNIMNAESTGDVSSTTQGEPENGSEIQQQTSSLPTESQVEREEEEVEESEEEAYVEYEDDEPVEEDVKPSLASLKEMKKIYKAQASLEDTSSESNAQITSTPPTSSSNAPKSPSRDANESGEKGISKNFVPKTTIAITRTTSQMEDEIQVSLERRRNAYTPVKSDGTGIQIHDKSPLMPFELAPFRRKAGELKAVPVIIDLEDTTAGASKAKKRTSAKKVARPPPAPKRVDTDPSFRLDDETFLGKNKDASTFKATRRTRRSAQSAKSSVAALESLLECDLLQHGNILTFRDSEAIILGTGWIESGKELFPLVSDWTRYVLLSRDEYEGEDEDADDHQYWDEIEVRSSPEDKDFATLKHFADIWMDTEANFLNDASNDNNSPKNDRKTPAQDAHTKEKPTQKAKPTSRPSAPQSKSTAAAQAKTNETRSYASKNPLMDTSDSDSEPARRKVSKNISEVSSASSKQSSFKSSEKQKSKSPLLDESDSDSDSVKRKATKTKSSSKNAPPASPTDAGLDDSVLDDDLGLSFLKKPKIAEEVSPPASKKSSSSNPKQKKVAASPSERASKPSPTQQPKTSALNAKKAKSTAKAAAPDPESEEEVAKPKAPSKGAKTAASSTKLASPVHGSDKNAKSTSSTTHTSPKGAKQVSSKKSSSASESASPESIVILSSGLNSVASKSLAVVTAKLGGIVEKSFTDAVTHLVVSTDDNGMASRTFKYLEAILRGISIVSVDWLAKSLKAGKYLPVSQFIVSGDSTFQGGPALAVKNKSANKGNRIFKGLSVCLYGDFADETQLKLAQLKHLLQLGGAKCSHYPAPASTAKAPKSKNHKEPKDPSSELLGNPNERLICDPNSIDQDLALTVALSTGVSPITVTWILDSISRCSGDLPDAEYHMIEPSDQNLDSSLSW